MHPLTLTRCVTSIQEVDVGIREMLYLKPQGSPSHLLTPNQFYILVSRGKHCKPAPNMNDLLKKNKKHLTLP